MDASVSVDQGMVSDRLYCIEHSLIVDQDFGMRGGRPLVAVGGGGVSADSVIVQGRMT